MEPVGDDCMWSDPPHSGIGAATTLPVKEGDVIPKKYPIGFGVWPEEEECSA